MTTNRLNLEVEYVRGTERVNPVIRLRFRVPFLQRLKVLFLLLIGKPVSYALSEEDIEDISHKIVRWRLVTKLREAKKRRADG